MARGYQKIIVSGMVAKDPEIRAIASGTRFASFSIPTTEVWNDRQSGEKREKTQWHNFSASGPVVDVIEKHVTKGSMLTVEGKNSTREWEDQSGNKRTATEIRVVEFAFMGGGNSSNNAPKNDFAASADKAVASGAGPDIDFDDDSVPF